MLKNKTQRYIDILQDVVYNYNHTIHRSLGKLPASITNDTQVKVCLVQKETQCFYLQFLGLKIIDFKNCFNSMVLPSNKDLDLHSFVVNWIPCSVLSVKF